MMRHTATQETRYTLVLIDGWYRIYDRVSQQIVYHGSMSKVSVGQVMAGMEILDGLASAGR